MAITPRMILTQPAPAAVLGVALFGMTIIGTHASQKFGPTAADQATAQSCERWAEAGPRVTWSERGFAAYAMCHEQNADYVTAVSIASEGLRHYPGSEILTNILGYTLIEAGDYSTAMGVLDAGVDRVNLTDGTMENNLAWAILFAAPDLRLDHAREYYTRSLRRSPGVCEVIHTGMVVEFARAREARGIERAAALKEFYDLRRQYLPCENRDASWGARVEMVGVVTMDHALGLPDQGDSARTAHYAAGDAPALCAEGMPLRDLRDECVDLVREATAEAPVATARRIEGW